MQLEHDDDFLVIRFRNLPEAARVSEEIHSLVATPFGEALIAEKMEPLITKPDEAPFEPVLHFNRGAIAAARVARIRLPNPEGSISADRARRGTLVAGTSRHAAQPA
jgi:hypothetical protein